jgi:hypothetical protein
MSHPPQYGKYGTLFPANFPLEMRTRSADARGLLLRGVVLRVYAPGEGTSNDQITSEVSSYCDVFVYSSRAYRHTGILTDCLISQDFASIYDGEVRQLRPSSQILESETLDVNKIGNPADLDGDHVLIGFLDGDFGLPVVLRQIPHPFQSSDYGLPEAVDTPGHRAKPKEGDPSVRLTRHKAAFYGIREDGSIILDASRGRDTQVGKDGKESPLDTSSAGPPITLRVRPGGTVRLEVVSNPDDPDNSNNPKSYEVLVANDGVRVRNNNENNLILQGGETNATLALGSATHHVAIVEHLADLYAELKTRLDAFDTRFESHVHASTFGPTAAPLDGSTLAPATGVGAPAWDPNIASTKMSLPDG